MNFETNNTREIVFFMNTVYLQSPIRLRVTCWTPTTSFAKTNKTKERKGNIKRLYISLKATLKYLNIINFSFGYNKTLNVTILTALY